MAMLRQQRARCSTRSRVLRVKIAIIEIVFLLTAAASVLGQTPKSHEECIKLVPGDWGPNFGEEWHRHEAVYWGCRLAVPSETVVTWQKAAGEVGLAQQITIAKVEGRDLVVLEEMDGSAHCFDVKVLVKLDGDWKLAWRLPIARNSMDYCTGACPALRTKIVGGVLTVESPTSSDPNEDITVSCKHVTWRKETFRWTGRTFAAKQ